LERTAEPSSQPSLYEAKLPAAPLALIVGNERAGVDPDLLALCDGVFALPMIGSKSSLNVAWLRHRGLSSAVWARRTQKMLLTL
jgi:tRNA C32,U32 (ribose-2'-O)-methylase TrmJ